MRIAIVHLSDIHFDTAHNSIESKVESLAGAICSTDQECTQFIIVLSGDVSNTGSASEFGIAERFLTSLSAAITASRPGSVSHFLSVPGNHDCALPKEDKRLRDALIS